MVAAPKARGPCGDCGRIGVEACFSGLWAVERMCVPLWPYGSSRQCKLEGYAMPLVEFNDRYQQGHADRRLTREAMPRSISPTKRCTL